MKRIVFFALIFILSFHSLKAQNEIDFGVQLGVANYLGDIGGGSENAKNFISDMQFQQTSFAFGAFFRYGLTRNFAAKLSFNYARIKGADSLSSNPSRIGRNLSFRTDLLEFALSGEYTFFHKRNIIKQTSHQVDLKLKAFAGIGALFFYPFAQLDEHWFELRPLQTEGVAYSEVTLAVPLGISFDFVINRKVKLGMEFGYRISFTDYLDDISTRFAEPNDLPFFESANFANRSAEVLAKNNPDLPDFSIYLPGKIRGNPNNNDGYFLSQITFSYILKPAKDFYINKKKGLIVK